MCRLYSTFIHPQYGSSVAVKNGLITASTVSYEAGTGVEQFNSPQAMRSLMTKCLHLLLVAYQLV